MMKSRTMFIEELNLYLKKFSGVVEDTELNGLKRMDSSMSILRSGTKFLIDLRETKPAHNISDLNMLDTCLDTLQKKSDIEALTAVYLTDTPQQVVFSTLFVKKLNAIGFLKVGICSTLDAAVKGLDIDLIYLEMIRLKLASL